MFADLLHVVLVVGNGFCRFTSVPETGFHDAQFGGVGWCLLKIAYTDVVAENHFALFVTLLACQDGHQSALACSVFGYQTYVLALVDGERDVLKQCPVAYSLCQSNDFEIWCVACHDGT